MNTISRRIHFTSTSELNDFNQEVNMKNLRYFSASLMNVTCGTKHTQSFINLTVINALKALK